MDLDPQPASPKREGDSGLVPFCMCKWITLCDAEPDYIKGFLIVREAWQIRKTKVGVSHL